MNALSPSLYTSPSFSLSPFLCFYLPRAHPRFLFPLILFAFSCRAPSLHDDRRMTGALINIQPRLAPSCDKHATYTVCAIALPSFCSRLFRAPVEILFCPVSHDSSLPSHQVLLNKKKTGKITKYTIPSQRAVVNAERSGHHTARNGGSAQTQR